MIDQKELLSFLLGLGLFLYGMLILERSLKELSKGSLQKILRKFTKNHFSSILTGAFSSAFLQSSSVVLLITIAFAGAGVLKLSNALGIVLGANLGTTATGWLVSTLGFKVDLELWSIPLLSFGLFGIVFFSKKEKVAHLFSVLVGIGFFIWGLTLVKESMLDLTRTFDSSNLQDFSKTDFFLFGLIITAIIQSSSATIAIVLGAVHAGLIPVESAIYTIIGADLGTTATAIIAGLRGKAVKKRIGLSHFFFNIVTSLLAIAITPFIFPILSNFWNASEPLYLLTSFHSLMNAIGILIFYPLLNRFERFLSLFFIEKDPDSFYPEVSPSVPDAAIAHSINHLNKYKDLHIDFLYECFISKAQPKQISYQTLKSFEDQLIRYLQEVQKQNLSPAQLKSVQNIIESLSFFSESLKSAKDIRHNIEEFHFSNELKIRNLYAYILSKYSHWLAPPSLNSSDFRQNIEDIKLKLDKDIFEVSSEKAFSERALSVTFLNVNRELALSISSYLSALFILNREIDNHKDVK
jgi:phosphate:Na+ symporter